MGVMYIFIMCQNKIFILIMIFIIIKLALCKNLGIQCVGKEITRVGPGSLMGLGETLCLQLK